MNPRVTPSSSLNPETTPLRRRNGRRQACEPCRKRKVGCDHQTPVCGRCKRGNHPERCTYLEQNCIDKLQRPSTRTIPAEPVIPPSITPDAVSSTHTPTATVGYLGATSFSAVFQETQESLLTPETLDLGVDHQRPESSPQTFSTSFEDQAIAIGILRTIPERNISYDLFRRHVNPNDGWSRLAAQMMLTSLWHAFHTSLDGERQDSNLALMAIQISENTAIPIKEDHSDPEEWFTSFSGTNLRWEALGILFTSWAYGTLNSAEGEVTGNVKQNNHENFLTYRANAIKCAELARVSANHLALYLLYKNTLLESCFSGDTSLKCWRMHADVVAVTLFLGLHKLPQTKPEGITVSSEINRRLFFAVFNIDKVLATFTGRPPLLGRKYCSTSQPLDLNDESLLRSTLTMKEGISALANDGWNSEGKIHSTTILRVRARLAWIRDAILELALSDLAEYDVELLQDLKKQEAESYESFPAWVVYQPSDLHDTKIDTATLYTKLLVQLEHLQNLFFIERLLIRVASYDRSKLLEVSVEMVSLTVLFWTHQNRLSGIQSDFEWLLMSYGAPAGGVMCQEVLRPSLPPSNSHGVPGRSFIIQKLSLLRGFLDWVRPTAPNAGICTKVKVIIDRTLDQALSPVAQEGNGNAGAIEDMWDATLDVNEFFNFDLLDTFDWLRPPEDQE